MSDETTNAGAAPEAGAQQEPPVIRLVAHYTRDLSFENIAAREGTPSAGQPEISVNVNLDATVVDDSKFQIAMIVKAEAKSGESTRFMV